MAEEAVYQAKCLTRFRKGLCVTAGEVSCGRPENVVSINTFDKLYEYLETSCEQGLYTLDDLYGMMKELAGDCDETSLCTVKHIKNLLLEKYGTHIFLAEVKGQKNVVCFREFSNFVVSDAWYSHRNVDSSSEHERIVETSV